MNKQYIDESICWYLNHNSFYWLPTWLSGKEPVCDAEDTGDPGSVTGWEKSPGGGHDNPLQYSCLENPMDRGAWWATVHGVTKSWTQMKQPSMQA